MPGKRKRKSYQHGRGIFSSIRKFLTGAVTKLAPIVKKSGVIGNAVSAYNPSAGAAVKAIGYGRRHRGRGQAGGCGCMAPAVKF